jgi:hypothetical protein
MVRTARRDEERTKGEGEKVRRNGEWKIGINLFSVLN